MLKQLYPACDVSRQLEGTYLALNLHQQAKQGEIFIYANYIVSLDGRIALFDAAMGEYAVPPSIANRRDWRLYQELAGQADVMLTSARYFRQLAEDKAQDLLPVGGGDKYADIKAWRKMQGLKSQPDVMVLSNSLDIPLAALEKVKDRQVIVLTSSQDVSKIENLENTGVVVKQTDEVTGQFVRQCLIDLTYRSAYMIAGPQVHATLIQDKAVNELFLTTHFTLLGGTKVSGLVDVDLDNAQSLKLKASYLDTQENQLFQRFSYV
ncbi:MAG: dihydrofolate reductase family protein [Ghiorsea sp.]|nr:dihydrofolate reductase family protein [Ghiorsea sp.]